ncbi:MAG: tRNA lysidine(34) synthetase TilS [Elusimicrobiota bacterium]|jgi:tRNA(Ile)-lysidine synthase
MTTSPETKSLLGRLAQFDRAHKLIAPKDRVLIAVSGGPDSVCLAHHLRGLARKRRLKLALAHFHHGLRGREADRDAAFVRGLALRLGLPLFERSLPVQETARKERRSLEDAGRSLRYRALAGLARAEGFDKIATGHQLDDQAETLLLHLLRGTQAKGLAGIPAKRPLLRSPQGRGRADIELIRPLLPLRRAQILRYLREHGLSYRKDLSNDCEEFTRNWVRRKLLPLLESKSPRIREHLWMLSEDLRRLL